jgi:hypothetical protein
MYMSLATPIRPTGIGQHAAMNVLKASFSEDLSTPPQLHAWDDYLMLTTLHKIFTGTTVNGSKPMIGGIGLTVPPAADWFPTTKVVGAAVDVASLLMGDEGFCVASEEAPLAEEEIFFNLDYKIPSDLLPADTIGHVVSMEYQYTGDPPVVVWKANAGTEETPDWVLLFPGVEGSAPQPEQTVIRPVDAGEGYNGTQSWKLTIPKTGQKYPDEIWLMDYAP